MTLRPSDLLRRALSRLLGPAETHVLGDLDEELARERRRRGAAGSELWYAVEAASLAAAVIGSRLTEREGTMEGWVRDLGHAVRGLRRQPGSSLVICATLAVAVGATSAIFAVADAAFLGALPYPEAERLVRVYSGSREDPEAHFAISPLDLRDLDGYDAVVEEIAAWSVGESVHLTDAAEPLRLEAPRATPNLFGLLGVEPALGRFFLPEESEPGADDAVVLSHGLWVEAFGADPAAVGRTVTLDGDAFRVVGVAPSDGPLPMGADLWRPLALGPEWYDPGRWGWQFLSGIARLRPGVDPAGAGALLTERLAESVPGRVERGQVRVVRTLAEERLAGSGPGIALLFGAGAMLLVMACANIMNVLMARTERRGRELALRRALGSGPGPLVRLVALETAVLAGLGGAGGLLLAHGGLRLLREAELTTLPYLASVGVDLRAAAFALAVTAATAAFFGAAPVRRALRADPQSALRGSGAPAGGSRRARRTRDALVVAQVATAYTLLVALGLCASAFFGLLDRDPGFRPGGVLTAAIELPADGSAEERSTFYRALLERVRALPGVESAGAVAFLPLSGVGWSASIELVDPHPAVDDPDPGGNMRPVSAGYFETLGIPLLEGRAFTDADDAGAPPVVVVDETLARRYWPGGSPVGRTVRVGALSTEPATIVGVVGAVPDESLWGPDGGHVYFPVLQRPQRAMTVVLRSALRAGPRAGPGAGGARGGDAAALAAPLRAAIRETDPRVPVTDMAPLAATVRRSLAAPRTGLLLLGAFGAVGLVLAAVGIYGVLAYTVSRRTAEIGTRMAVGAAPGAVLGSVVGEAMRLWLAGAALGLVGAAAAGGLLGRFVEAVEPTRPGPFLVTFIGLGAVALLAALLPALRATRVDPARALRTD